MKRERIRAFGAARGEHEYAQPFGGDLGVGDTALDEQGGGAVAGALLQPPLDHHRALVEARGVPADVLQCLLDMVRPGVEQLDLGGHQLGEAGAEGLAQSQQNAFGRLNNQAEPHDRAAGERDDQCSEQPRQRGDCGPDEQGHKVDLKPDESQGRTAITEPAAVDRGEDQGEEDEVARDDLGAQQRSQ